MVVFFLGKGMKLRGKEREDRRGKMGSLDYTFHSYFLIKLTSK